MIRTMKTMLLPLILLVLLAIVACGSTDESLSGVAGQPGQSGAFAQSSEETIREVIKEVPVVVEKEVITEVVVERAVLANPAPASAPTFSLSKESEGVDEELRQQEVEAQLARQGRIIVRTVDMQLVVDNVAQELDNIASLAREFGGWVVSSDRSQKHNGFISFRVPADKLDDAILQLRRLSVEVDAETTTSRDVTDEYVDLTARLKNLQATEEVLLKLLDRAEKVEDALSVQRELTVVQEGVERLQGRIKFLEQTAAFSLINVGLRLAPMDMFLDAGPDQSASVGRIARFRASFKPPEGIEDFNFVWDFGDGTPPVSGRGTAPSLEEDTRFTATVTHVYGDDRDSPFIAEIKMTGFGDAGVVEAEDTLIITISRIPVIEVFAGENISVDEDEEMEFIGSFTRPEGLSDLKFKWDFGDGSSAATGDLEEGTTNAIASHAYADHRPFPYTATLTVTGQSEAGEVEASGAINVFVNEGRGLVISGWSAGDQGKTAVRTLSGVGQAVGTVAIWLGIFSPLWIIGGVVALIVVRRERRRLSRPKNPGPPSE